VRTTGTVAWYDADSGFGYITPDDGGTGCFVHHSAIEGLDALSEGDKVEFDIVEEMSGSPAAEGVVVLPAVERPE